VRGGLCALTAAQGVVESGPTWATLLSWRLPGMSGTTTAYGSDTRHVQVSQSTTSSFVTPLYG
jgi:hypothetical protein